MLVLLACGTADGDHDAPQIANALELVDDVVHCRVLELGVQRRQHEPDAIVIGDRDELGLDEVVVLAVQAVERGDDARLEEIAHGSRARAMARLRHHRRMVRAR